MFELEYDSVFGVYKVIIGDDVILTGTDDHQEAQEYAQELDEPEIEHLGQVTDPAAHDEESDSARWRAERRLERLEDRDELDLY